MSNKPLAEEPEGGALADDAHRLGAHLRAERLRVGRSLRQMAADIGVSPSALSQIETGRSRPSARTLYAIVSHLGMSLDELFRGGTPVAGTGGSRSRGADVIQHPHDRKVLQLESGVSWERLTPYDDPDVDFLYVVYQVGGASSAAAKLIRHNGREYGLILSGRLKVTVGSEDHELAPGDSISFDSTTPHRLEAVGDEPVHGVWFVLGRHDSDVRMAGPPQG